MASWAEFESREPEMAAQGRALLLRHQVAYLATIRHDDGGPRVQQVCPCVAGGELYVSISGRSPKLRDLRTDGRYMLHFMCGDEDAEFNARGTAAEVMDGALQASIRAEAAGQDLRYTADEVLFRLDVQRVDTTVWERFGTPEIRPMRRKWVAEADGAA